MVYEGRDELMDDNKARYAQRTPARTLAEILPRRRRLPRPLRGRRAEARDGGADGAEAADPRARQSRARDHAGRSRRRCAPTRSSPPAAPTTRTRSTTSSASRSSSAARSTSARRTINEAMKLACVRAIADLALAEQSDIVATAYGIERPALRPRVPDPEAVRSAPDRADRAGGGEGGDGLRRRDAADRRTSTPTAQRLHAVRLPLRPDHEADLRGGEAGRRKRIVFAEGEDERVLRAVQVVVDEGLAQARSWSAGRRCSSSASSASACASAGRRLRARQSRAGRRATATTGASTTG